MSTLPLSGIRVVDISSFLAGPMVSMFLGDYGADVIKVEHPGRGDEVRFWGENKDGVGLYYKVLNRNKRSVTADLRTPMGVEIVKRLAGSADVIIENFRPGTLERWGLGYDVLSAINPGIVLARITGYGQTGPNSHKPGFGTVAEGFSGCVYVTGYSDRPPLLPAFGLADSTTGLSGAFLVMVALFERERRGGAGQVIDLAIYEPLFTLIGPHVVNYDQLGVVQQRTGSRIAFTAPRNTFRTRDGNWVVMSGSAQSTFERTCRALDRPELIDDPRFGDNRKRLQNVEELEAALAEGFAQFDLDEVLRRFDKHEAAIAPVYSVEQIFSDPHFEARGNIATVTDEELGGPVRMQNVVGGFSRTPGEIRHAGPRLGQHNREVLIDELGFSAAELKDAGLPLFP